MSYKLESAKFFVIANRILKCKDASSVASHKSAWSFRHQHEYVPALAAALCLVTACLATIGCVTTPKRPASSLVVPSRCLKMTAESFTRPCSQRSDGKLVCDGVVVTATCVEVANK
jgi:hypothetical protein